MDGMWSSMGMSCSGKTGQQGEVAELLHVKERLHCIEYCPGADEEQVESLWVRIKGQAGIGDTVVGVC